MRLPLRAPLRGVPAGAMLVFAGLVMPGRVAAQAGVPCVRLRFASWSPALEWNRMGHRDSAGRWGEMQRRARDSVYDGSATAQGRDEMQWEAVNGRTQLTLFPAWWPAGVAVTFSDRIAPWAGVADTLVGTATAFVADAGVRPPRAGVSVVRTPCP